MASRQHSPPPIRKSLESTPFPSRQLSILALCRICEPIAFMSIFPYIYYMIASFKITNDNTQIAFYAGMVTSAFALAEFCSGVLWGRLSDIIGRKPVLLCGLAGTGISMIAFGFAPSLPIALLARALGGLLNGNIGVLQTTVAEVVTVDAHQPLAYSIMPFIWCLGSIIGSGLGGTLADPVTNYPSFFLPGTIFERFPYLLPNLVCTVVVVISLLIGILFLEETHEDKKHRRDIGLACGQWILARFRCRPQECLEEKQEFFEETLALLVENEDPPGYRSAEISPRMSSETLGAGSPRQVLDDDVMVSSDKSTARAVFSPQIMLNILSLGILAYHTICAEQLLPVLLAMEKSHETPSFPFKFLGGFDLPAKSIGFLLSVQGFIQMIVQLFIFPIVNNKLGTLRTFRLVALTYPILYVLVPYLSVLPDNLRMLAIYPILLWKVTAQALSYPANAIMLANAAPSKKVLGTLNGVAASAASLARAVGPTLSGLIQAAGLGLGSVGLPWWVTACIAIIGSAMACAMNEVRTGEVDYLPEDHAVPQNSPEDISIAKLSQNVNVSQEEKDSEY